MAKNLTSAVPKRRRKNVTPNKEPWNAVVIVDLMRQYGFAYVPLNPDEVANPYCFSPRSKAVFRPAAYS